MALAEDDLPPRTLPSDGPPPPRVWADKDPVAAERLTATRAALTAFAEEHTCRWRTSAPPTRSAASSGPPPEQPDVESFGGRCATSGRAPGRPRSSRPSSSEAFTEPPTPERGDGPPAVTALTPAAVDH